ncbi:MAG: hypothetical protein JWM81_889 [Candidatus Saccharibacteria bacterium]|nr:hypothetical protein [Candidatus Saccharibacteria bacterium]
MKEVTNIEAERLLSFRDEGIELDITLGGVETETSQPWQPTDVERGVASEVLDMGVARATDRLHALEKSRTRSRLIYRVLGAPLGAFGAGGAMSTETGSHAIVAACATLGGLALGYLAPRASTVDPNGKELTRRAKQLEAVTAARDSFRNRFLSAGADEASTE